MMLRRAWLLLLFVALVCTGGCTDLVGALLGGYTGPAPEQIDIVDEVVVVRRIYVADHGGISSFLGDRLRYLEKDPHNVNRLVDVKLRDLRPVVEQLRTKEGDTLRISTRFHYITEASGPTGAPDWPYEKYFDYPMGSHLLTNVERVAR